MNAKFKTFIIALSLVGFPCALGLAAESPTIADAIAFGDAKSEANHALLTTRSDIIAGGLGESARRLLPLEPQSWEGGRVAFTLKVNPTQPNYATVKLWGSDATRNLLILFCEGKQIGYRHLGDYDILDIGGGAPGFKDRFIYVTTPLPLDLTRGKSELHFEIRCVGPTWGYAATFEKYQQPMTGPTRGIYKMYSHTDGAFTPPAEEKQGVAVVNPPVRTEPGEEMLAQVKGRVSSELKKLLESKNPLNEVQLQLLARAYHVKWTPAYHDQNVVTQVVKGVDALFAA